MLVFTALLNHNDGQIFDPDPCHGGIVIYGSPASLRETTHGPLVTP